MQFYHLDIRRYKFDRDCSDVRFIAALAAQLPQSARIFKAENPDAGVDYLLLLVRRIEQLVHVIAWQQTEDGQKNRNTPSAVPMPSELLEKANKEQAKKQEFEQIDTDYINIINRRLGYDKYDKPQKPVLDMTGWDDDFTPFPEA